MKVTFDGINKVIKVNNGITEIEVKADIYSAWKSWVLEGSNAKYLPAISVIGGDPISETISLGSTFFLENGWKIRPYEGDHNLTINGNLFTRDGLSPFVSTMGNYNVLISMNRSNLIDTVSTGGSEGSGGSGPTTNQIATTVWNFLITDDTAKELLDKIERKVDDSIAIGLLK